MTLSDVALVDPIARPASPSLLPLPQIDFRWLHAGAQHLDLLPTPITTTSTTYKPFSLEESNRIEEEWWTISEADRRKAVFEWGNTEGEGAPTKVNEKEQEKEFESKGKERRGSGASDSFKGDDHNVAEHANRGVPVEEASHAAEGLAQMKGDGHGTYQDLMQKAQKEYEQLELIAGIPVSQVSLTALTSNMYRPILLLGLLIRSFIVDVIITPGILGTHRPQSVGAEGKLVRRRRNATMLLGARGGDRERVSVGAYLLDFKRVAHIVATGRSSPGRCIFL